MKNLIYTNWQLKILHQKLSDSAPLLREEKGLGDEAVEKA